VPNVTEELRMSVKLVSITFRIAKSPTTGAVMVVMRRRMVAAKRRKVPIWWSIPVRCRAILLVCFVNRDEMVLVARERVDAMRWRECKRTNKQVRGAREI
jgi:hypothetical protein